LTEMAENGERRYTMYRHLASNARNAKRRSTNCRSCQTRNRTERSEGSIAEIAIARDSHADRKTKNPPRLSRGIFCFCIHSVIL